MNLSILEMFSLMIFGHALADYPLQGEFLAKSKNRTAPVPAVLPYASNNRQKVQPSAGVRVKQVQGSGGLPLTTPRTTGSNLAPLASINPKHVQPGASVQLRKCAPGVTKC